MPQTARKYDQNGWYEVPGNPISRAGVFDYLGSELPGADDPDRIYRVYRPASELADQKCIDSFKLLPWVNDHTTLGADGMPAEQKGIQGILGEQIWYDWKKNILRGNVKIFSNSMEEEIDNGKRELSLGYTCDVEFTPGVSDEYGPYDAVQKHIRGNHLALVDSARMGPDIAVLDENGTTVKKQILFDSLGVKGMSSTRDEAFSMSSVVTALKNLLEKIAGEKQEDMEQKEDMENEEDMEQKDMEQKDMEQKEDMENEEDMEQKDMEQKEDMENEEDGEHKDMQHDSRIVTYDEFRKLQSSVKKLSEKLDSSVNRVLKNQHDSESIIFKNAMTSIGERDALAQKLMQHVGTFDYRTMTKTDVARYGVKKLKIPITDGQEITALQAALHVMPQPDRINHTLQVLDDYCDRTNDTVEQLLADLEK